MTALGNHRESAFLTRTIDNWIYVTGIGRSGTTFIGKVLSRPLSVDYIHEPFNPQCGLPGIDRWDPYRRVALQEPEDYAFHRQVQGIFSYDFALRTLVPTYDRPHKRVLKRLLGSRGPVYLAVAKLNPFHRAAVIKAPIGLLLTEYMYHHFQVKPVIVIKHPVSVMTSLQRVNWWPNPSQVLDQPQLIEDYFADDMDFVERQWDDPVLAIAAYWRIIHKVLLAQAERYSSWQVVSHEALCEQPVATFHRLYQNLDLPWSAGIERHIRHLTEQKNTDSRTTRVHDFTRSSKDIFLTRLCSIPKETRRKIFDVVQDVALQVYSKDSFLIE
ncbi:hypothetical protein C7271_04115 [filamentous cyanobacterium CCP5]|nr:hypothetical protein C7271_04115 [filamentous cyanobacterium CCP5]